MSWKVFDGAVRGTRVDGDPTVAPTRWWNHLYLLMFCWKKIAVFQVMPGDDDKGYYIGYVPMSGRAMISTELTHTGTFSVKEGFEPCTFFALDRDGREIPLELVLETRLF